MEGSKFGDLLRRLRRNRELTQEALAERARLSVRGVSDLERGVSNAPHQSTVIQLADALELPPPERAALLAAVKRRATASLPAYSAVPVPPTLLVGRERDVMAIRGFLDSPTVRLTTLTGPGGVGKTRLALEVASQLQDGALGQVHFVPLAPLRDAALVAPTIAEALGVRETTDRSVTEGLVAYLHGKQVLLVLDNLEHLLEAAGTIAELLSACSKLQILATSRAPLRIHGEQEYPVQPLEAPDPRYAPPTPGLARYPSIELFAERARGVRPEFRISDANARTVAEICYRLDGLPLAIELAAARVKVLAPRDLLVRLDRRLQVLTGGPRDVPARLQTMRDAIAWSYNLLEPDEQTLFRRLSVFAGGFTLEAVDAIWRGAGEVDLDTLEGLTSLVDKSLVAVRENSDEEGQLRFTMLETVREFAYEQLTGTAEADSSYRAHARYFLALAEEAESKLRGPDQRAWLDRLEAEHDNLRTALRTTQHTNDVELGLRLVAALWIFWRARCHLDEAERWFATFLPGADSADISPSARARALYASADLICMRGDNEGSSRLLRQALDIARESGDDRCAAAALLLLGEIEHSLGDCRLAGSLFEESLAIYRILDDQPGICAVVCSQAALARFQGDYRRATSLFQEALSLSRALGDIRRVADTLARIGNMQSERGRPSEARALFESARELHRQLGDVYGEADILLRSGEAAVCLGDYAGALELFEQSLVGLRSFGTRYGVAFLRLGQVEARIGLGDLEEARALAIEDLTVFDEIGNPRCTAALLLLLGDIAREQHSFGEAAALYRQSLSLNRELSARPAISRCFERMARLARAEGQLDRAARLHGAASALRDDMDAEMAPGDRASYGRDLAAVRRQAGEEAFRTWETQGAGMGLQEAVAFALEVQPMAAAS